METVFDYNITDEEREHIGVVDKDTYFRYFNNEYTNNLLLAYLFWRRGDKKKAAEYADRLPLLRKYDFYRTVTHP